MNRALQSEAYARQCFINYNYKGNTMGITASEMGEVTSHWSSRVNSWKNYKEKDSNDYHISEKDWNQGHEDAKNDLGYDRSKRAGEQGWRTGGSATSGLVNAGVGACGRPAAKEFGKMSKDAMVSCDKDIAKDGAKQAGGSTGGLLVIASCVLDGVNAAWYRAAKPNAPEKKASEEAAETLPELQNQAAENDSTMDCLDEELQDMTDIASETTEEANDGMAELKTDYEMNADVIEYYKKAQVQGYQLTADDYETWKQSAQYMTENGEEIAAMNEEAAANVEEIRDDMDNFEGEYNDVADNMDANITYCDYVAGFDESTYTQTLIQAGVQGLGAATSGLDAASAFSMAGSTIAAPWVAAAYAAAGAVAVAAGISDGLAAAEQYNWSTEIDAQIEAREATEDMNDANIEHYDENVDYYEGYKGDVDDLCLEVPDDVDEPEEPPTPGAPDGAAGDGNTGDTGNGNGRKVKKL